jgi:hypothetical protein
VTDVEERPWAARDIDFKRIWEHLLRQRADDGSPLDQLRQVRLDDGRIVRVGSDAEGEDGS